MKQGYKLVSILLVEDDEVFAKSVERGFRKHALDNPVHLAKNGAEALRILRNQDTEKPLSRPYIILLDLQLPIMNGLEFLQTIRDDDTLSDSVVFVITTSSEDKDRVAAYGKNIAGYIVKCDVEDRLSDVIEMLNQYCNIVLLPT